MSAYCMFDLSVYYLFLQYFDTVGWVFWPVDLYCVGGDGKTLLNPIQSCAQIMSKNLVQIRITLSTKLLSFVAQQWRPQNLQANLPQRITSEAFDV